MLLIEWTEWSGRAQIAIDRMLSHTASRSTVAAAEEGARARAGVGFRAASAVAGSLLGWAGRASGASRALAAGGAQLSQALRCAPAAAAQAPGYYSHS